MSIGDLKDYGNKGNNFPWQLKVLQGLQCICDEVKEINIDTDDLEQLLADLIAELQSGIDVTIVNPLGQEPMATSIPVVIASDQSSVTTDTTQLPASLGQTNMAGSVSVALASNQNGVARTPTFLRPTGANGTVAAGTFSMSFASVGTGNAIVGGIILKPGETLNFDAGAINNTLGAVTYDTTTNAGAELIIITLT